MSGAAGQGMQLPHDVRGLMPFRMPWWEYVLIGVGAVAVAAALLLLARYLMNRRRATELAPLDPWVHLQHRFAQLGVVEPFVKKAQGDFFYQLSLLVREGIELRTAIPATDRTLKELKDPLRKKLPLATPDVQAVLSFLERADMVKFAEAPSTADEAKACLDDARRWLRDLKPQHAEGSPFAGLPTDLATNAKPEVKRLEMG